MHAAEGARLLLRRDRRPHRLQLDQGEPLADGGPAPVPRAVRRARLGPEHATTSSRCCRPPATARRASEDERSPADASGRLRQLPGGAAELPLRPRPAGRAAPAGCRASVARSSGWWSRLGDWLSLNTGDRAGALALKLQQGAEAVSAQKAAAVVASTAALAGGTAVHEHRAHDSARSDRHARAERAAKVRGRRGRSGTRRVAGRRTAEGRASAGTVAGCGERPESRPPRRGVRACPGERRRLPRADRRRVRRSRGRRWGRRRGRGVRPVRRLLLVALVPIALLAPAAADAGVYEVHACGGPAGAAQSAFAAAADPQMEAYSICPPQSAVGTGIATKATSSGGIAAYGAGAYQVFTAPAGASLAQRQLQRRRDPAGQPLVGGPVRVRRRLERRRPPVRLLPRPTRLWGWHAEASRSALTCRFPAAHGFASRHAATTRSAAMRPRAPFHRPTARCSRRRT